MAGQYTKIQGSRDDLEIELTGWKREDEGAGESGDELNFENDTAHGPEDSKESPIDVVNKVVPTTDDPAMSTLTFRVLLLGTLFCAILAGVSQLFFFKSNTLTLSIFFVQLVSLPLGRWCALVLPTRKVHLSRFSFDLNPGPFTIKEHVLICVCAAAGGYSAYASDILAILDIYFHRRIGPVGGILLLLTTQMVGYGLAGMLRNLLVRPTAMIWPANLVAVSLYTTLHESDQGKRAGRRNRMFMAVMLAAFLYQLIPTLILPSLTSLAVLCLVGGDNSVWSTLGSGYFGFGYLDFSLDWTTIGFMGPLFTPYWAQVNYLAGLVGMIWVIMPILYYANWWDAKSFGLPLSSALFNSSYQPFNVTSVVTQNLILDDSAWEAQQPLLLTPYFALVYAISFASLASVLTHVYLWHMPDLQKAMRTRNQAQEDVHCRLMDRYPEVPAWVYGTLFLSTTACAIFTCEYFPIGLPWYMVLLALAMATVMCAPIGVIQSLCNIQPGLNVITEFVCGFILPGRPIANVAFKCIGYMGMSQALGLVQDLKLGHYMKIPPRHMLLVQIYGTVVGCIVNYSVLYSVIEAKRPFLDGTLEDPTGQWTGRAPALFYSASVIWGAVGPARFFVGKYVYLYSGFLVGFLLPILPWWLHKRYRNGWMGIKFDQVNVPVILMGAKVVPQMPTNIITTGLIAAYLAQSWARRHFPDWYARDIYIWSAGLDTGTAISTMVCFVAVALVPALGRLAIWDSPTAEHCKAP